MSYFYGGSSTPAPDLEQDRPSDGAVGGAAPNELAQIDQAEKDTLLNNITVNKYPRRQGEWQTRRDLGVREFLIRTVMLTGLYLFAYMTDPKSERGQADKKWLLMFSLMMIIFFALIHAMAYLPSAIFASFSDLMNAARGRVSHAYTNWRDYHYCAALMVAVVIIYPIVLFFTLIVEGFSPYEGIDASELNKKQGMNEKIVSTFRWVLHTFLVIALVYLTVMLLIKLIIRGWSRYPGQHTWIALKMSKFPYGALFFQEGEFFDCGVCLASIWIGQDVVRLSCGENHVFHEECLREQIATYNNKYCVLCPAPIQIINPPPLEESPQ